jgi:hypothetical protein
MLKSTLFKLARAQKNRNEGTVTGRVTRERLPLICRPRSTIRWLRPATEARPHAGRRGASAALPQPATQTQHEEPPVTLPVEDIRVYKGLANRCEGDKLQAILWVGDKKQTGWLSLTRTSIIELNGRPATLDKIKLPASGFFVVEQRTGELQRAGLFTAPAADDPIRFVRIDGFFVRGTIDKVDHGRLHINRITRNDPFSYWIAHSPRVVIDGVTKSVADLRPGMKCDLRTEDDETASEVHVFINQRFPYVEPMLKRKTP